MAATAHLRHLRPHLPPRSRRGAADAAAGPRHRGHDALRRGAGCFAFRFFFGERQVFGLVEGNGCFFGMFFFFVGGGVRKWGFGKRKVMPREFALVESWHHGKGLFSTTIVEVLIEQKHPPIGCLQRGALLPRGHYSGLYVS